MYQVNGMIFGPVDAQDIINKLYSGELNFDSRIAEGNADWIKLYEDSEMSRYAARAMREHSEYQEELEKRKQLKNRRMAQLTFIGVPAAGVLLLSLAIVISVFVVRNRKQEQIENITAWAERPPPVISLGSAKVEQAEKKLTKEQKLSRKQKLRKARKERRKKKRAKRKKSAKKKAAAKTVAKASAPQKPEEKAPNTKENGADTESDIKEFLSNSDINKVINRKKKTLYSCIIAEAKENPMMPNNIIMEFTIENSGKVGNVTVETRELGDGNLESCFKRKMTSWKFPEYYGERRNVTLPFNVQF